MLKVTRLEYCWYPFLWHISTSLIQPSPTALWVQFMYFIIFYHFKAWLKPMQQMGEIEEVWFEEYESVSFEPFAWT